MRHFLILIGLLGLPALALPSDVPPDLWAARAVDTVMRKGWLEGFPGGDFAGETLLNRYQLATILTRVLSSTQLPLPPANLQFSDIVPGHWAIQQVSRAVGARLMQGFPDQTFRGEQPLTRYQLAVVLAKLVEQLKIETRLLTPADLPAQHWASTGVKLVTGLDLLPLDPNGRFQGDLPVSRYQLAVGLAGLDRMLSARKPSQVVEARVSEAKGATGLSLLEAKPMRAQLGQKLLGLGQSLSTDQAVGLLDTQPNPQAALLRLSESPAVLKVFPLQTPFSAMTDNWALASSAKLVVQLEPRPQPYGGIGAKANPEALPQPFAQGQSGGGGGIALNPAQEFLAVLPGSPLCVPSCDVVKFSRVLRLALLTTKPVGLYAEYLYPLDAPGNQVVGLSWPEPRNLLVNEQTATASRIYRLELSLADDLAFGPWDQSGASLELQDPAKFKGVGKELIGEFSHKTQGLAIRDRLHLNVLVDGKLASVELSKSLW